MHTVAGIKMEECPEGLDLGDRSSEKVIRRLEKVKLE